MRHLQFIRKEHVRHFGSPRFLLLLLTAFLLAAAAWADSIVVTFDVDMTTRRDSTPTGFSDSPIALDYSVPVTFDMADAVMLANSSGGPSIQIDPATAASPVFDLGSLTLDSAFGNVTGADVLSHYFITEVLFGSQYSGGGDNWAHLFDLQLLGPNLSHPRGFDADEFLQMLRRDERRQAEFSSNETLNQSTGGVFLGGVEYIGTATIDSIRDPAPIPEPASFCLLGPALLALFARQREQC
jgi:hypothetical protein